jgi:hypothetical protein
MEAGVEEQDGVAELSRGREEVGRFCCCVLSTVWSAEAGHGEENWDLAFSIVSLPAIGTVQEDRCWKPQNVSEVDTVKKKTEVWCQWLTLVILATWGTEIRRIMILIS